jgi:hypothetical protein
LITWLPAWLANSEKALKGTRTGDFWNLSFCFSIGFLGPGQDSKMVQIFSSYVETKICQTKYKTFFREEVHIGAIGYDLMS